MAPAKEKHTTPTLGIFADNEDWGIVVLKHSNLTEAEIRLYHIDLEVLFSKDPFLSGSVESSLPPIAPNHTAKDPSSIRRLAILATHSENGSRTTVIDR